MYSYAVTIFVLLCVSLVLSALRTRVWAIFARIFQWIITLTSITFFVWWFFEKSISNLRGKSLEYTDVKIVNRLPENIDFYIVKCDENIDINNCVDHIGRIRQNYYRSLFFNFDKPVEYHILGFVDNKKLIYSALHSTETQVLEIKEYINQDQNISDKLLKEINSYNDGIVNKSILISLDLLLIFLHLAFLVKKENLLKLK